ncbi:MAG: hypothetical protein AAF367_18470 [Pseudomonadota bacterium]
MASAPRWIVLTRVDRVSWKGVIGGAEADPQINGTEHRIAFQHHPHMRAPSGDVILLGDKLTTARRPMKLCRSLPSGVMRQAQVLGEIPPGSNQRKGFRKKGPTIGVRYRTRAEKRRLMEAGIHPTYGQSAIHPFASRRFQPGNLRRTLN